MPVPWIALQEALAGQPVEDAFATWAHQSATQSERDRETERQRHRGTERSRAHEREREERRA